MLLFHAWLSPWLELPISLALLLCVVGCFCETSSIRPARSLVFTLEITVLFFGAIISEQLLSYSPLSCKVRSIHTGYKGCMKLSPPDAVEDGPHPCWMRWNRKFHRRWSIHKKQQRAVKKWYMKRLSHSYFVAEKEQGFYYSSFHFSSSFGCISSNSSHRSHWEVEHVPVTLCKRVQWDWRRLLWGCVQVPEQVHGSYCCNRNISGTWGWPCCYFLKHF